MRSSMHSDVHEHVHIYKLCVLTYCLDHCNRMLLHGFTARQLFGFHGGEEEELRHQGGFSLKHCWCLCSCGGVLLWWF